MSHRTPTTKVCARVRCGIEYISFNPRQKFCTTYCKDKNTQAQRSRRHYIQKTHGITLERYQEMLDAQGGVCAICGTSDPHYAKQRSIEFEARFNVDHDHKTGKIRGLLCTACNFGLGKFGDSPDTLRRAADYLTGVDLTP